VEQRRVEGQEANPPVSVRASRGEEGSTLTCTGGQGEGRGSKRAGQRERMRDEGQDDPWTMYLRASWGARGSIRVRRNV
jgi:hypothetical protein